MRVPLPGPWRRKGSPASVLFSGQAYYNAWYLSRELRKLGWRADVLNWDSLPSNELYYHGEDFALKTNTASKEHIREHLKFLGKALLKYDIFHFSNAQGIQISPLLTWWFGEKYSEHAEIRLLKRLGKKIVYSNNGCLDGALQSSFASWGDRPVCLDCPWRERPDVCSDEHNRAWGSFRNSVADYQVLIGGNRIDYNDDPRVHEVPEFYCLDPGLWRPDLEIPDRFRLDLPESTVKIYHAVGNYDKRTSLGTSRNIKSTHIYVPLVEELKREGHDVELIFFHDVPNRDLRYYQVQADLFVDMLTFGFFGATAREGMMLGKPVVCYLRPEWLEQMRAEIPEYVDELPVVSATPDTIHDVLVDLITHPEKRAEIGRRSREFAVKWHSAEAAADRFHRIYSGLLDGRPGTESFR